uniref:Small ribosomal subunit protein mS31 n=1 Tax=Branchiostoma floridae TaxID=7739 RepID=C3YZP3_BRAFL|eukprot:XP_002598302.1 hypothetical protein BRAFLDRAFT_69656 [Branchiostoma floridae]
MGCKLSKNRVHPVDIDVVPAQWKESWFERKIKVRARKLKRGWNKCFNSELKGKKDSASSDQVSVPGTQDNKDAPVEAHPDADSEADTFSYTSKSTVESRSVLASPSDSDTSTVTSTSSSVFEDEGPDTLTDAGNNSDTSTVTWSTSSSVCEDEAPDTFSYADSNSDTSTVTWSTSSSVCEDEAPDTLTDTDSNSDSSTVTWSTSSSVCEDEVPDTLTDAGSNSDTSTITWSTSSSVCEDEVPDTLTDAGSNFDTSTVAITSSSVSSSDAFSCADSVVDISSLTSSSSIVEAPVNLPVSPPRPSRGQTTLSQKIREEILLENITMCGYELDPVPRNGDCFFASAARQLGRGDPSVVTTAQQLRQHLVQYIRAHSEKFSVAVTGGFWAFQQQLDNLSRQGHWCSDLADTLPVALADFTSREVALITSRTDMPVMILAPEGEQSGTPLAMSYIDIPGGEHYDALKYVGG